MMTKRERLDAALRGEPIDRLPISAWLHFGSEHLTGEESADRHIAFQKAYDWDFVKVMNDYRLPLPGIRGLKEPADLLRFEPLSPSSPIQSAQLTCLRRLRIAFGPQVPLIDTLFNPLQAIVRAAGRGALAFALAHPAEAHVALEAVTETHIGYLHALRDAGADGIFYSINGAVEPEWGGLTDAQYAEFVDPYDRRILEAAEGMIRMVHAHGVNLRFDRCADYPGEALSWSHFNSAPSLSEARALTSVALIGGMNEKFFDWQSEDEVAADLQASAHEAGTQKLVLGPGCALPSDTPHHLLLAAVAAARAIAV